MAWVSLQGCAGHLLSGIPMLCSFLPVLASPVALKKGAGCELGLLEQDLERMYVVSLAPNEESSESQKLSEPSATAVPGAPCH